MNVALGTLRRREREQLARRRKAEGRAARERARNSRLALVGFIGLAAVITLGIHTSWTPPPIKITSMKVPTDAESRKFAQSHVGRLFFNSLDGAICREMQFNNDSGRLSDDRSFRCAEADAGEETAEAPVTDARARGFSLRNGFTAR